VTRTLLAQSPSTADAWIVPTENRRCNIPLRERIEVIGIQGAGKTYGWLGIAEALPNSTFHVIDPDDGVERLRVEEFPDLHNIKYYFTPEWYEKITKIGENRWQGGIADAAKIILNEHKDGDWIIIEQLGSQWDMAQATFTDKVFEQDIGQYFLDRRVAMQNTVKQGGKDSSRLEAFAGWKDWTVIKKIFNDDYFVKMCYRTKAHLYVTSTFTMDDQQRPNKDPGLAEFYGGTKVRIDGEKRVPLKVQTCLLLSGSKNTGWKVSTFQKDRGRKWLKSVPLHSLYYQYLVRVAGWVA